MKNMKFLISIGLILIPIYGWGQELPPPVTQPDPQAQIDSEYYRWNNPFEKDLNKYKLRMDTGALILLSGIITLTAAFVAGTTTETIRASENLNLNISQKTSNTIMVISVATGSIGAGLGIWGFARWNKAANNYHNTLRLQTSYYNLISQ